MSYDIPIMNVLTIPAHELEITTSRSGGPGGQHVNKTSSRITVRWNIPSSSSLTPEQKDRLLTRLGQQLTNTGDLIVHASASRSQLQNKEAALAALAARIRSALYVPKKRMKTKISTAQKDARLRAKTHRSEIKSLRRKDFL